jgi:hypothetical protein
MTIIVDIRPEVQAVLARRAAAQGRALEAYAASLLENAVHISRGHYTRRVSIRNVRGQRVNVSASYASASRSAG